ncbi:tripartite motif-containing protein 35-like [Colossoma macropomum]|uniref:tripartite motif-containing protein 35-like n=1 Tax=Colossoma macropomum TaxID=42526 RepID=UPI0018645CEF|nr:tripartite motif-containing protein 35-like [Colossoma macropomum]
MPFKGVSEKHISCPVCCEIFRDPVLLGCSHSVCKSCLEKFWEIKGSKECPVCKRKSSKDHPPLNLTLKNLCEAFAQEESPKASEKDETLCGLHSKELTFFCLDDQQPLCSDCSKIHTNHRFCALQEKAVNFKTELNAALKSLKEKQKIFQDCKQNWDETAEHIKTQAQDTERQIKEEFEKLHQFLRDEEAARIAALREEEQQKSQIMTEKIEKMSREIEVLSDTIRAVEEQMRAKDVSLIRNYKVTLERAQCKLQDPEKPSVELLHVAKHLSNVKYKAWHKMENIVKFSPVTLDPNTAHAILVLSDELTTVRLLDERQQIPDNPERFDYLRFVLGSVGFNSGTHCWDVEVGDSKFWGLGVITESANRKGNVDSRRGMWGMLLYNSTYAAGASPNPAPLPIQHKVQRITVQLDWNKGKLSFTDSLTNKCLRTVKHRFTETVFPFFYADEADSVLRILPTRSNV